MHKTLLSLFLIIPSISFGQSLETNTLIQDNYSQYFELPRETIYLHLNKSVYVFGEDIWFKGYVYDTKNKRPATKTSNIYVSIYDKDGKQIKNNLFLGYEGFLRGNFQIDSTLTTGKYYIKASTNWMKNFTEDDSYVSEINIINEDKKILKNNLKEGNYDLQLLPESGHALLGIRNTIGVKIIDTNGKGVGLRSGKVIDHNNNVITSFKTNRLGIGKLSLNYEIGKTYYAIIELLNGQEVKQVLPKPKSIGANINITNTYKDKVIITINKTEKTIDDEFKVLLHTDGNSKSFDIKLKDQLSASMSIPRADLIEGINTITLFNKQNKPVAERLFYNHMDNKVTNSKLKVTYDNKIGDSLIFNVSIPKHSSNYYNLSISVLPNETESYNHPDNIKSNFKLRSYLKGNIENPKYYFTDIDRKKKHDLDLLLLTQGWSRYSWNNIFNNKPKSLFEFENGLTLNGQVNTKNKKRNTLYLFPLKNNSSKIVELDQTKKFRINNLFPETNELVKISYASKKETKTKPKLTSTFITKNNIDKLDQKTIQNLASINTENSFDFKLNTLINNETTVLDEVLVTGENKTKHEIRVERSINEKIIRIEDGNNRNLPLKIHLLRKGYRINQDSLRNTTISSVFGPQSIFLDNVLIEDPTFIFDIPITNIDELVFWRYNTSRFGLRASPFGVIEIKTRKTWLPPNNGYEDSIIYSSKVENGFTPYKEFYNPKYSFSTISIYEKYGVVHWFSDVFIKNTETLKIPDYKQDAVKLFIEGMSDTGDLISEVISIDVPDVK